MLARKIHTILLLVAAYYTSIRMIFHTHHRCLYLAYVCLIGSYLEHGLVLNFKELRTLTLHRQTLPSSVRSSHVFNVVLVVSTTDGRVDVTEMLVVREVDYVVGLPSNRHLASLWDLYYHVVGRSLYDVER